MIKTIMNAACEKDNQIIAATLIIAYMVILLSFGYLQNINITMFWSQDAQSYRAVGYWLFGNQDTNYTLIRPFFYPLMLNLSQSLAGIYGIWCYQVLLWVLSGVLLYQSIKTISNHIIPPVIGVIIYASNISLLLLTLHALTEVTVIFLLTVLINLVVNKQNFKNTHYWLFMIFIVSLLTVTKPVYYLLLICILIYRIPFFILKLIKCNQKLILSSLILIALCPVLIQLLIMKVKHDEFTISKVGVTAVKSHFLPMVYVGLNKVSLSQARKDTNEFDRKEMIQYLLKHPKQTIHAYFILILSNVLSGSNFIHVPKNHTHLYEYVKLINKIYFVLHLIMILPLIILIINMIKNKKYEDFEMVLSFLLPFCLIISTSGISYFQGDRIILPSLPIWIVLYFLLLTKARNIQLLGNNR